ncbi:hypothetical protein [Methylobacterium sp. CM6247]
MRGFLHGSSTLLPDDCGLIEQTLESHERNQHAAPNPNRWDLSATCSLVGSVPANTQASTGFFDADGLSFGLIGFTKHLMLHNDLTM